MMEAGQLCLVPTRPLSQLGLGSTRPGQLGLFIFLMVNRDITYVPNKKFGRYDLEYAEVNRTCFVALKSGDLHHAETFFI